MIKIDFKGNQIDFWKAIFFAINQKISMHSVLEQAFEQKVLVDSNNNLLLNFLEFLKFNKNHPKSQLMQDLFAAFILQNKSSNTFLEFGATDGLSLSNSYMLEKNLGWFGVLAEPDIQWIDALKKNRPNTKILTKCIWSESGEILNFFSSENGVLSTLDNFKYSDSFSMPGNSDLRNKKGKNIKVETISLNDVITNEFKDISPSYISIDTEGSEYEILSSLNFQKYRPSVFTIEHNFTELQNKIDELMVENNYIRVFKNLTSFDAWYVSSETMDTLR